MRIKKWLGKYKTSERQSNTCSAVSCIYWTFDVIINSEVFFHNTCECTCPNATLEHGQNFKSSFSDLIIYEEVEKNSYLDRSIAQFMVGKGS